MTPRIDRPADVVDEFERRHGLPPEVLSFLCNSVASLRPATATIDVDDIDDQGDEGGPSLGRLAGIGTGQFGQRIRSGALDPMTKSSRADHNSLLPTSRKLLCVVYGVIAIAALVATWSQNVAYFDHPARSLLDFANDSKVTPSSRSLTVDILFFFFAAAILMVIEARKHGVKFVWLYILGGAAIAISVTFPLFLIARELRMGASDAPSLPARDTILLAVSAVLIAGLVIYADVG
jgi:uncharacterized protein DUF2834